MGFWGGAGGWVGGENGSNTTFSWQFLGGRHKTLERERRNWRRIERGECYRMKLERLQASGAKFSASLWCISHRIQTIMYLFLNA